MDVFCEKANMSDYAKWVLENTGDVVKNVTEAGKEAASSAAKQASKTFNYNPSESPNSVKIKISYSNLKKNFCQYKI